MTTQFTRRHFIRGTGALIALPALESIGFRRFASAAETATAAPPKRMVFLGFGFGVTQETWFPNVEQTGADYKLPEGLGPLARHKDDFTVVQGCSNQFSNEAHWGSTFWLTGANRFSVPGQSMANSISADQVAAQQLGQDTRFAFSLVALMQTARAMDRGFRWLGTSVGSQLRDWAHRCRRFTNCSPPICRWNNAKPPSPNNAACWMPL